MFKNKSYDYSLKQTFLFEEDDMHEYFLLLINTKNRHLS